MAFSGETLTREIQMTILDIFKEFKRICEENNLRYYAIGGTCIGAIRHRGFIPWDDDLDVAMPFEDYQKFRSLQDKINAPYELFDYAEKKHAFMFFLKLHNGNTTFVEKVCMPYKDRYIGAFIDIMPLYGFPTDEKEQKKYFKKYFWYYKLNRVQRFPLNKKGTIKSKIRWCVNAPMKKLRRFDCYSAKIERILSANAFENTEKIFFGWRMNSKRMVFDYKDFETYTEMPFEDTTIRVPVGYDNYLKCDFGDYMKIPPKEKQISSHSSGTIDLNKSYRDLL